jgi:uncharacterized protein
MSTIRIGLISDTHGLMRPQALSALQGVERIIHAGDIGNRQVLDQLAALAPVTAVRGNNDGADWAAGIPETETLDAGGIALHVLHDVKELKGDPAAAGYRVVISGHSHRPSVQMRNGVLFVNPGSAGPRRFSLPVTVALLEIADGRPNAHILPLDI